MIEIVFRVKLEAPEVERQLARIADALESGDELKKLADRLKGPTDDLAKATDANPIPKE